MDTALLIAVFALAGVDTGISLAAFQDGYVEANPLLRPLADTPLAYAGVKLAVTTAATTAIWHLTHDRPRARWLALAAVVLVHVVVISVNIARYR